MKVENSLLMLEGELDVDQAQKLREILLDMVKNYPDGIVVDLGKVTGVDVSILQLLVSARQSLSPGKVVFKSLPPELETILEEMGLPL